MAEHPTPQELRALDDVTEAVACQLAQGTPHGEAVSHLVDAGWDRPSAQALVATVGRALEQCCKWPGGRPRRYGLWMLVGFTLTAIGSVVLLFTYKLGAGVVIIPFGPILAGLVMLVAGLVGRLRSG